MNAITKATTIKPYVFVVIILIWMASSCSQTYTTTIRYSSLHAWLDSQNIDFPKNIHWDVIETYSQVSNISTNPASETLKRSYLGYYDQAERTLRINIQIVLYRKEIDSQYEETYSYDFNPDAVFIPEIKALENYDVKTIECGRNFQKSITVCIVHFNFNNRYSFYVIAHGDGQIDDNEWNQILNWLFAGVKIDDLVYIQ